ncbi:MAG: hypothetical protein WDA60_18275 [Acidimicrobiia bacterium]|jgi:hypothetical protein
MAVGVSGVLLLIFSFFNWYSVDFKIAGQTIASASENGWGKPDAFLSILAIIFGVVMAGHVIVDKLAGVEMPERLGSIGWGVFYLAGGVLAFVFLLIKFLGNTDYVQIWFYLAILCTLGLAVGGFLTAKERGDLAALQNRGGASGGSTPPAA